MRVLILNSGSSSLKLAIWEDGSGGTIRRLHSGSVAGADSSHPVITLDGSPASIKSEAGEAIGLSSVLRTLQSQGSSIDAIAHRVVHGGDMDASAVIDAAVMAKIEAATELAPLHNGPALKVIGAAREAFPATPMVAVFDTSFHHALPDRARLYALDRQLTERHSIRRYGFHGLAHRDMSERWAQLSGRSLTGSKLITLQLGSGCSAAAIADGRSIDTSMGFTPLEGLIMETRPGDLDPGVVTYLAEKESASPQQIEEWLNQRSGLLGIAGRRDMRELLEAEAAGDRYAALAIDMFVYRVQKYIGAYLTVLGGAEAIIFGGGIGENSPLIRARIIEALGWLGVRLDPERNEQAIGTDSRFSADSSAMEVWTIAVDEGRILAEEAVALLDPPHS